MNESDTQPHRPMTAVLEPATASRVPSRRLRHLVSAAAITLLASLLLSYVFWQVSASPQVLSLIANQVNAVSNHSHTPAPTGIPTLTPSLSPTPLPTPKPTPTPPISNLARDLQMGCAFSPPPPLPYVVYTGRYAANPAPAPHEVALTFDDGPTPYSTPAILDVLERTHTPATFFVEGSYVHVWPYLLQREWHDGFAVGVHTWDHPQMTKLTADQRQQQIGDTIRAIHGAIGQDACVWFWRPPYGDYNDAVVQSALDFGLSTIMWDVDPADWSRPGTDAIVQRVLAQVVPGSVILMHDGPALREQTAEALPTILAGLKARGLTPVTLPRLLADGHYPGIRIVGMLPRQALRQPGGPLSDVDLPRSR